jgi:hypothetical protein
MVNKRQTTKAKTGLTPPRKQNKTKNNKNTKNNTNNNNDNKNELITVAAGFAMGSNKKYPQSAATSTS